MKVSIRPINGGTGRMVMASISVRNLRDLAAQLDAGQHPQLVLPSSDTALLLTVEDNAVHYADRAPGPGSGLVDFPPTDADMLVRLLVATKVLRGKIRAQARLDAMQAAGPVDARLAAGRESMGAIMADMAAAADKAGAAV